MLIKFLGSLGGFNSRTREGCDSFALSPEGISKLFQFTHPGGVRRLFFSVMRLATLFQFTHPGGVRPFHRIYDGKHLRFQFTHPGGVRRHNR